MMFLVKLPEENLQNVSDDVIPSNKETNDDDLNDLSFDEEIEKN